MAIGKYLSLVEAIREGLINRFAKQHLSEGDGKRFDDTLSAMIKKPASDPQASARKKDDDG